MKPKVSIVITHYNQERTLPALLRSVKAQTFGGWKVLFYDCYSRYRDYESILARHFTQDQYMTAGALSVRPIGRNRYDAVMGAISWQKPDYVAIVDADDVWEPDKLALQLDCFRKDENARLVFSDCRYLVAERQVVQQVDDCPAWIDDVELIAGDRTFSQKYPPPRNMKNAYWWLLTRHNFMPCPTLMFEANAWRELVESTPYTSAEDYDWVLRMAKKYPVAYVPKPLAWYRIHEGQVTQRTPAVCTWEEIDVVRLNMVGLGRIGKSKLARLFWHLAVLYMKLFYKRHLMEGA